MNTPTSSFNPNSLSNDVNAVQHEDEKDRLGETNSSWDEEVATYHDSRGSLLLEAAAWEIEHHHFVHSHADLPGVKIQDLLRKVRGSTRDHLVTGVA
jgi:hypothetical protein